MDKNILEKIALSIRTLSMDGVQAANSGHPGLPMGCAEIGAYLYAETMKINPAADKWINRDRFVLTAGHGSMFVYSLLHLCGFPLELEELKNFRQLNSKTPGHPEYGHTIGVETTTGPLGAGISNAVGMAIAETMLASRFNTAKHKLIDHHIYALSGDGCMMEGVSSEAASLAGHLKLDKLIVFYDSNKITIEGSTDLAFTEDVAKRYEAYGWQVLEGDGHNYDDIDSLVKKAKAETSKPSLIIMKTTIGKGSPNMAGSHKVHGAALGEEECRATRKALGIGEDEQFYIAPEAKSFFADKRKEWEKEYQSWQEMLNSWKKENPQLLEDWEILSGEKDADLSKIQWPSYSEGDKEATRKASGAALNAAAKAIPNLVGGSADLAPSNNTAMKDLGDYSAEDRKGRNMHFGVREHAMGGIANGMALYAGLKVFSATFLVFSDYMRPAIRLAALMEIPVVYVFTHDSIFVGEDGPTHQPIEHAAALRVIPNLLVLRPGDSEETNLAWKLALEQKKTPAALLLTRQGLAVYKKDDPNWQENFAKGAYIVKNCAGSPETVLVASGSEVNLALEAAALSNKNVRVVSMPEMSLFLKQDKSFQESIIPSSAKIVAAEAGTTFGWSDITSKRENVMGINRFGLSAPGAEAAKALGLTAENLAKML